MIHIGQLIRSVFDDQLKLHNVAWLAKELSCQRGNIYKIFKRESVDAKLLMELSLILEHDFFADLSKIYQETNQKEHPSLPTEETAPSASEESLPSTSDEIFPPASEETIPPTSYEPNPIATEEPLPPANLPDKVKPKEKTTRKRKNKNSHRSNANPTSKMPPKSSHRKKKQRRQ